MEFFNMNVSMLSEAEDLMHPLTDRTITYRILDCLQNGFGSISEIADIANINPKTAKKHLERLSCVGIIKEKRVGRARIFSLNPTFDVNNPDEEFSGGI